MEKIHGICVARTRVAGFADVLPVEQTNRLSWSLGLVSVLMVAQLP